MTGLDPRLATELTLRQKQSLLARLLAELILWIYTREGCEVTLADGAIDTPRKFRDKESGVTFVAEDAQHVRGGQHYRRLAQDFNLFFNGVFIADGGHPEWTEIGVKWESLHPLCRWGGRFGDANHFSLEHEGKA